MGQSATNDPLSLVLSVGGYSLSGYAGGSPLRWSNSVRRYDMAVGLQGLGAFTKIRNKSGALLVDVMQESDDNGVLNRFRKLDEETDGGLGVSVSLQDITGTLALACLICHIDGPPDISLGAPGDIFTWAFLGVDWNSVYGGRGPTPTVSFAQLPDTASEIPVQAPPV